MHSYQIMLQSNGTNQTDWNSCLYSTGVCAFGKFLWNVSLFLDLAIFAPQVYKLHRKKRYQNVANGLSLCWISLITCSQAGNWRWFMSGQNSINPNYAIIMEVWLFLSALGLLCYTMVLSETHFDYQRPVTLGLTLLGSAVILTFSLISSKYAGAMRGLSNILAMIQIYPQLLLSELLETSKAVSVWTIILLLIKYCFYYGAQYILLTSTEEFIFAYMSSCMFLAAFFHCFAYPTEVRVLPGSNDISRSQFTVLPPATDQSSQATSGGIDGFFSIDEYDTSNEIDNTPVNLPTVTARRDGHRTTFVCLSWYTLTVLIVVWVLLLTILLLWKIRKFSIILSPLCIVLLFISIFSVKHFVPDRFLTLVKFIL